MPFFEPVPEDQLSPESKRLIEIARKRTPTHTVSPLTLALAAHPRVLKGFVEMIGVAAQWNLNTTIGTAMDAGLAEE